jgi:gamma-glutamyl hercynylcysteine S-oxide synthase
VAAIVATQGQPDESVQKLMATMHTMTEKPLSSYSAEWKVLPQQMVEIPLTELSATAPAGMVTVPGGDFVFKVKGVEIEGTNDLGVDVQYPWEDSPRRFHGKNITIRTFYLDKYPVTNQEFEKFVNATHYHPQDDLNFLHDWKGGT